MKLIDRWLKDKNQIKIIKKGDKKSDRTLEDARTSFVPLGDRELK